MQVKVMLALVVAALVAGLPEPEPEPEPETNVDVKVGPDGFDVEVDSGDKKLDGYIQHVKTAGQSSFKLISKLVGQSNGDKCCRVEVAWSSWPGPTKYIEYPNGAKDVPCGGRLAGKNGTCVDGNVVCDIDNMGTASSKVTFEVNNTVHNEFKSIIVDVVPGSSLFDVMIIAKQIDKLRFTYKLFQGGVSISSIDGVERNIKDGETWGSYWALYNCTEACDYSQTGVSTTYPNNGDIWQFTYVWANWTTSHSG